MLNNTLQIVANTLKNLRKGLKYSLLRSVLRFTRTNCKSESWWGNMSNFK